MDKLIEHLKDLKIDLMVNSQLCQHSSTIDAAIECISELRDISNKSTSCLIQLSETHKAMFENMEIYAKQFSQIILKTMGDK
jgi:hypothetical protein